jgi:hypothetical protein
MILEYEQRIDEYDAQGLSQSRAIIIFMKHDKCDLSCTCSKIKGSKNTRETSYDVKTQRAHKSISLRFRTGSKIGHVCNKSSKEILDFVVVSHQNLPLGFFLLLGSNFLK